MNSKSKREVIKTKKPNLFRSGLGGGASSTTFCFIVCYLYLLYFS